MLILNVCLEGSNVLTIGLVVLFSLTTGPDIITLKGNVNGSVVLLIINVSNLVDPNKNIVTKSYGLMLKVKDKTTLVV